MKISIALSCIAVYSLVRMSTTRASSSTCYFPKEVKSRVTAKLTEILQTAVLDLGKKITAVFSAVEVGRVNCDDDTNAVALIVLNKILFRSNKNCVSDPSSDSLIDKIVTGVKKVFSRKKSKDLPKETKTENGQTEGALFVNVTVSMVLEFSDSSGRTFSSKPIRRFSEAVEPDASRQIQARKSKSSKPDVCDEAEEQIKNVIRKKKYNKEKEFTALAQSFFANADLAGLLNVLKVSKTPNDDTQRTVADRIQKLFANFTNEPPLPGPTMSQSKYLATFPDMYREEAEATLNRVENTWDNFETASLAGSIPEDSWQIRFATAQDGAGMIMEQKSERQNIQNASSSIEARATDSAMICLRDDRTKCSGSANSPGNWEVWFSPRLELTGLGKNPKLAVVMLNLVLGKNAYRAGFSMVTTLLQPRVKAFLEDQISAAVLVIGSPD